MSENKLFRKKSLEKISSPEQLNDYITVTTPGVWMILVSIILVLSGAVVWGIFGELDTRIRVPAVVVDDEAVLYVKADDLTTIKAHQTVEVDDYDGFLLKVGTEGVRAGDVLGNLVLAEAEFDKEEIVYEVDGIVYAPDGVYLADIIVDSVSPLSFLTNDE